MTSVRDNFYPLLNFQQRLSGPSSPALWHTLFRLNCRQSPPHAHSLPVRQAGISGTTKTSIPGRTPGYHIVVILTLSLFISCCTKTSRPKDILSKNEMAKVMTEFYLKESKINSLHLNQDSALALFQYYRENYAAKNNIPDSVIERSYQYYLNNPVELSAIYDRIIDSLALKEQRATVPVKTQ